MGKKNPKVDAFLAKSTRWQKEYEKLRSIILDFPLDEEFKWGNPCYSLAGTNVVLIHGFNEYCALLFFKGALLKDKKSVLVRPGENTQAARQMRFTGLDEVKKLEPAAKAYIKEAMDVEKAGLKVTLKKTSEFNMPEEFQKKLDKSSALKKAFEALTPGRQRAYLMHFSAPKQSKTREARVEKSLKQILAGKGINE